ncbi:MAG: magnesium transporter [Pseudomonadota bacterium]
MPVENATHTENLLQTLRDALDGGTMRHVRGMLNSMHPAEVASLLESLPPARRAVVWELIGPDDEGEVLLNVNDEVRSGLIDNMEVEELVAAADGLEVDDLADLIISLPEAVTQRVLQAMEEADRQRLQTVLAFDEDSAGGLMNTDTITVRPDVTVEVVLRYLRMHGEVPDGTDTLFVVDRFGRLIGSAYLSRLLTADPESTIAALMLTDVPDIPADMPATEVAKLFENHDLYSAAVVDEGRQLLGRITVDDVVDVIRDEAEHTVMSMAGLDEEFDMFSPVFTSARRRAIWLAVNLATAFVAARVVGVFEATIEQVVALAVLMPVVASMGGIAGSQTLTIIIRGVALGQVGGSNARWLMNRELAVAAINGVVWAVVIALIVVLWFQSWMLGAVIGAAIVINLLAAALAGVVIPLSMKRLGIDPALAGSVVLTTVTDVVGFTAFLGLGALLLV